MITIRAYNKLDRDAIRQICCDVADRGGAIENFFPDRDFAADILTGYYTDYEPENSFVAESDGKVVAYVNGCLDNRRFGLVLLFIITPQLILKGLIRGVFFHPEFWQIFRAMLQNWRRIFIWRKKSFHSHQGHMHIGVSKAFRRQQIGKQLVNAFLNYAREQKIDQMTASVHDGNLAACRFFDSLGFIAQEHYPMIVAYGNSFKEYYSIFYVKNLD